MRRGYRQKGGPSDENVGTPRSQRWVESHRQGHPWYAEDQGYGRGGTPVFTCEFEQVARVTMYLTDDNGLDSCFGAA